MSVNYKHHLCSKLNTITSNMLQERSARGQVDVYEFRKKCFARILPRYSGPTIKLVVQGTEVKFGERIHLNVAKLYKFKFKVTTSYKEF